MQASAWRRVIEPIRLSYEFYLLPISSGTVVFTVQPVNQMNPRCVTPFAPFLLRALSVPDSMSFSTVQELRRRNSIVGVKWPIPRKSQKSEDSDNRPGEHARLFPWQVICLSQVADCRRPAPLLSSAAGGGDETQPRN